MKASNPTSPSQSIKVGIVEDDDSIREGLAFLIKDSPDFECVAACASAEEALKVLPSREPAIVLMDIGLPGMSGIECIRALKKHFPKVQIMMLTVFEDPNRIFQSLQAGETQDISSKKIPTNSSSPLPICMRGISMSNQIAHRGCRRF